MRLATWNCKMSVHTKLEMLRSLRADVVVLPECASPEVPEAKALYASATKSAWAGDYRQQGLAVLTFGDATLSGPPPIGAGSAIAGRVTCGSLSFNLLGVWAKGEGYRAYVEDVLAALKQHDDLLRSGPSVVAGDFNSNAKWDAQTSGGHANIVKHLESIGLVSGYHQQTGEAHGGESRHTYFQHHKPELGYHIDYVFHPREWAAVSKVEVPEPGPWLEFSDHLPLVLEVNQGGAGR